MRVLIVAAVVLLLVVGTPHAQQATPAEQIAVLAARLNTAEAEINNAYLALVRERSKSAELAQQVERWKAYAKPLYEAPPATN